MKKIGTKTFDTISMIALIVGCLAFVSDLLSPFINDKYSWFYEWVHLYSLVTVFIFTLLSGWLKKSISIILLLLFCNIGFSQIFFKKEVHKTEINALGIQKRNVKFKTDKRIGLVLLGQFTAGFLDGTKEAYLFHFDAYKRVWVNAKPNSESWQNKWAKDANGEVMVGVEKFPLSSTLLVWTTDPYHRLRTGVRFADAGSALVYGLSHKKKKWYWYVADFALGFGARSAGFHLTYSHIYKR